MKMIYIAVILFLCLGSKLSLSQQTTPTANQNYVVTNQVLHAGVTTQAQVDQIAVYYIEKYTTINYLDGLGRPLQTVEPYITGSSRDFSDNNVNDRITAFEYDTYGRQSTKYLPYSRPGFYHDYEYDPNWKANQATYYTTGGLHGVDNSTMPYSKTVFEPSPFNRPLAQGAPGTDWQPNLNDPYDATKKVIKIKNEINTAADNIRLFIVDPSTRQISSSGFYAAGLLYIKTTIDEHGGIIKEFTDKTNHLILKQVYIENNDLLQTYYVYDVFDLLSAVIQPEGVAAIPTSGSWTPDAAFISNWMFVYNYDERKRMINKQVPGAKMVTMTYDQWDRIAMTQDANMQAANTWLFTKYDALNRPIMTGTFSSTDQAGLQSELAGAGRYESVNTSSPEGYTLTNSFPNGSTHALTILTVTHYDSYTNLPSWTSGYSYVNDYTASYNNSVQGQVVATQSRVLGSSNWIRTVMYYDDKYRTIQTTTDNITGGKDRTSDNVLFAGESLSKRLTHTSQVYSTPIVKEEYYGYNNGSQVRQVDRIINGGNYHSVIIGFNDINQVITKRIEGQSATSYLQKLDYSYNIRGWLNGINQPYADGTGYDESDLFNLQLHYNTTNLTGSIAQYNGNISEQLWKGGYDEYLRGYEYKYDRANRLLTATYGFKVLNAYNSPVWDFSMKYSELTATFDGNGNINSGTGYDRNGNIKHLERFHGGMRVDALDYRNYNGNKLGIVYEAAPGSSPVGFQDQNNGYYDYLYDNNGNLTFDLNKGITAIAYNYLNLPALITMGSKGTIAYLYDAAGNKLQKTVTDQGVSPNKITITKYAGAFVYTNSYLSNATPGPDVLEFIAHEEGRIRPAKIDAAQPLTAANTRYIYDYFLKDHLGNTRMVLTTEQQTDLYAATQEPANATKENQLFSNLSSTTIAKPAGFDSDGSNTNVSHINGSAANTRVGPSIILKVMAGDVISVSTQAWYSGATQGVPTGLGPIKDQLLTLLTNGIAANNGTQHGAIPLSTISDGSSTILSDFLSNTQPPKYNSSQPKAFLNWIIVDEEFKKVTSSFHMGAVQVPLISGTMQKQLLVGPANMTVRRNGWLYVYVSNESGQEVYFDDLIINHQRGPAIEMNNYYPFGLEIPGLHSQAIAFGGSNDNRIKYNGKELQSKEFADGSGLTWDDYGARMYDPQIGRFMVQDPHSYRYATSTPYNYAFNNPISNIDPDGRDGKVSGAGTEDDPYTVTANYYYYGLNAKQTKGLNNAIAGYNNGGKSVKVKVDGKDVYVKFNLSAKESANRDEATTSARGDTYEASDGSTKRFGNIVNADFKGSGDDAYANSNNFEISLNGVLIDKHTTEGQDVDGKNVVMDYGKLVTGAISHEIGHNLTALHGDPGGLMDKVGTTVQNNQIGASQVYTNYPTVTRAAIGAMMQRIDKSYGTDYAKDADYIQATQSGQTVSPKGYGTSGRIYTEKKN